MKNKFLIPAYLIFFGLMLWDALDSRVFAQSVGGCTNYVPVSNETVNCTTGGTPSTSGVQTPQNNTTDNDITVNIQSGVKMDISGSTVGLGSGSTVTNAGSLSTRSFQFGYGISSGANGRSQAGGNTITNQASGVISTGGSGATGIYVWLGSGALANTITNDGSILTTGNNADGIRLRSDSRNTAAGDSITNTGTITTSGAGSSGVRISHPGNPVSLSNTGDIVAKGAADGIYAQGALSLTNSGKICVGQIVGGACTALATASGNGIQLIASSTNTNRSTITNQAAGSIVTTASGHNAINSSLTIGVDIYNYGSISAPGTAVLLTGGSNTLTLYGGSSITGGVSMNAAGTSETLTFSGYTNSNFSNAISGVNILKSLSGSNVTMTASGPIDFGAGTIEVDNTSFLQINSTISDRTSPAALATSINKTGSGTLNLTGANTYSGGTSLTAGTIGVGHNTALGTGSLTMSDGTTLQALSSVTLANGVTINGTSTFDSQGYTLGMSGVIGGAGSLSKIGSGTLNLTGANTYSGGTSLTAGTIGVGNNTALGTGSLTMSNNTTLQALSSVTLANDVTLNGTSTFDTNGQTLGMTGVISGTGSLTKISQGTLILNAVNTYTGNTLIQAGTLILNGSITSNTTLSSGTTLQGGGTIFGSLTSSGNIAPSVAGTPTNLTIAGNYTSQGGTFTSNLYPGATQAQADTLTISGSGSLASGQTVVVLNNVNNLGQPTVGDGILVVQTIGGAKTATNAFSYPARLAQGSYEYRLVRGGSASADNWYLRADNSDSADFVSPSVAESLEAAIQSGESITPTGTERLEVANYPALKSLGRMYSMSIVDNLDLRRGDLMQLARGGSEAGRGIAWGRMIATGNQLRSNNPSNGPGLDGKAYAAQLGADLYRKLSSEGALTVAGPFVTFGQTSGNTFNSNGDVSTGNTLMQGYTFGLNATHFAGNGVYVDGILQGTRFVGARANSIMGTSINTTGWGLAASLETGWKLNISQRFSVTPQAQVWLISNKFSDTSDAYSRIGMPTDTSTVGRVGVKLSYDTSDGKGPDTSAWLRISGLSTLSGRDMQTVFQNTQGQFGAGYKGQSPNSWMTVDAGLNVKTGKNSQLYLNIGYDTSLGNSYQGVYGRAGLQFAF